MKQGEVISHWKERKQSRELMYIYIEMMLGSIFEVRFAVVVILLLVR